jgi:hypothetical protein
VNSGTEGIPKGEQKVVVHLLKPTLLNLQKITGCPEVHPNIRQKI